MSGPGHTAVLDELEAAMGALEAVMARVGALVSAGLAGGPATARRCLPTRRPTLTARVEAGGLAAHATLGFDPVTARPAEVFLRPTGGARSGSQMDYLCDDMAVLISVALQYGVPAAALSRSLARGADGAPATIAGAALDLILEEGDRLDAAEDAA